MWHYKNLEGGFHQQGFSAQEICVHRTSSFLSEFLVNFLNLVSLKLAASEIKVDSIAVCLLTSIKRQDPNDAETRDFVYSKVSFSSFYNDLTFSFELWLDLVLLNINWQV